MTGKIKQIMQDFETKGILVTLSLEGASVQELQTLKGLEKLSVTLKKWRKKRSLDANAYYWVLLTQLAQKSSVTNNYLHNIMLRQYGQIEIIGDKAVYVIIPDSEEAMKRIDEEETYHLKPTSQVKTGKDGIEYRTYMLLRGSSSYGTDEMSRLIEGLVQECKEQEIETLSKQEIERMMQDYGKKHTTAT